MPSNNRRVRFAEDYNLSASDRSIHTPTRATWNSQHLPEISKHTTRTETCIAPIIDGVAERKQGAAVIPDQKAVAEHIVNATIAEQRARDAMLVARSVQVEIRSHRGRLAKSTSNEKIATPSLANKSKKNTTSFFDILKEQDMLTAPMIWITDIFTAQQAAKLTID
jgi:hypothetical protein